MVSGTSPACSFPLMATATFGATVNDLFTPTFHPAAAASIVSRPCCGFRVTTAPPT